MVSRIYPITGLGLWPSLVLDFSRPAPLQEEPDDERRTQRRRSRACSKSGYTWLVFESWPRGPTEYDLAVKCLNPKTEVFLLRHRNDGIVKGASGERVTGHWRIAVLAAVA